MLMPNTSRRETNEAITSNLLRAKFSHNDGWWVIDGYSNEGDYSQHIYINSANDKDKYTPF